MFNGVLEFWRSRPVRLAISVVMLVLSVIFVGDFLHLRGDPTKSLKSSRKVVAESLAVQMSSLASVSDATGIKLSLLQFVNRNETVIAASLETADGALLGEYGDVNQLHRLDRNSTLNHLSVPIFNKNDPWGSVKVAFKPSGNRLREFYYYAFVLFACFIVCLLFFRRALVQLDPGKVVPGRVQSAFNMFSEGVVILDGQLKILVTNDAAANTVGRKPEELLGAKLDDWQWRVADDWQAPWSTVLNTGINVSDQPLTLNVGKGESRIFMVSCTLVGEDESAMRGVLVTLNDMTAIEQKNHELAVMLSEVRKVKEDISHKNKELEALATRDPLTGLANRRALMETFEAVFSAAARDSSALCCLMVDIDHFKRINDTFGHGVGDEVICAVGDALAAQCPPEGMVGRFGGEEFVLVLPGMDANAALALAELVREDIMRLPSGISPDIGQLSASLGVAAHKQTIPDMQQLLDHADQALYFAKENGRNRCIVFDHKVVPTKAGAVAAVQPSADASVSASATGKPEPSADNLERVAALEAVVEARNKDLDTINEFDSLTGIPKRSLFLQRVETELKRAQRFNSTVGVLSLEIKDLGRIVSTIGHEATDELVVEFVTRLQTALRDTDVASRITSDHNMSRITTNEYGVLLADMDKSGNSMPVVTRLRRFLSEAFVVAGQKIYVGANIGISLFPQSGDNASDLLEAASRARLEAALKSEKISHSFASNSLDRASREYIELETDLHDAIRKNQFQMFFQPKFDLAYRQISGMEALLRWDHPERGLISPEVFVPIAEACGLIEQVSNYVLHTSLAQLQVWQSMGWTELNLALNISAKQLREPELAQVVLKAIETAGVPADRVDIEITETSMIDSPNHARIVLSELREAGVRISMDDFGTGYTSLALLAVLPLDSVKIDRTFIDAMGTSQRSRAIVESVINMSHALKLWVVGEGVETNAQLTTLAALGCNEIQGYLISRPLNAEDTVEFLEQQSHSLQGLKRA